MFTTQEQREQQQPDNKMAATSSRQHDSLQQTW